MLIHTEKRANSRNKRHYSFGHLFNRLAHGKLTGCQNFIQKFYSSYHTCSCTLVSFLAFFSHVFFHTCIFCDTGHKLIIQRKTFKLSFFHKNLPLPLHFLLALNTGLPQGCTLFPTAPWLNDGPVVRGRMDAETRQEACGEMKILDGEINIHC